MKHLLAGALALASIVGVSAQTKTAPDTIKGFAFTDVKVFPTTSVKNQNKSGTCWCFAGTSFIEDEIIRILLRVAAHWMYLMFGKIMVLYLKKFTVVSTMVKTNMPIMKWQLL